MSYKTILLEVSQEIGIVSLNRPERLNAFTPQMADELIDAFQSCDQDDAVRAVILRGNGRAFCAGMDLSGDGNVFGLDESLRPTITDLEDRFDDPAIVHGVRDTGGRVALAIFACRKPVVAAIHGAAIGVGATMTLAADFRIAADTARFAFPFARLGIVPEACSTWFLPRLVGVQQALEWCYRAKPFGADEARAAGLVRDVVPAGVLLETAEAFLRTFTEGTAPLSISLIRDMMMRNAALPHPADAHRLESLAMFYTSIGDGKEGVASFLQKRPATFVSSANLRESILKPAERRT